MRRRKPTARRFWKNSLSSKTPPWLSSSTRKTKQDLWKWGPCSNYIVNPSRQLLKRQSLNSSGSLVDKSPMFWSTSSRESTPGTLRPLTLEPSPSKKRSSTGPNNSFRSGLKASNKKESSQIKPADKNSWKGINKAKASPFLNPSLQQHLKT